MVFVGILGKRQKILALKVTRRHNFAHSLKIRMGQIHAIIRHRHHDRSAPPRNVPSQLCKHMRAEGEFLAAGVVKVPLLRVLRVFGAVVSLGLNDNIRFSDHDIWALNQDVGNLHRVLRRRLGHLKNKCIG